MPSLFLKTHNLSVCSVAILMSRGGENRFSVQKLSDFVSFFTSRLC